MLTTGQGIQGRQASTTSNVAEFCTFFLIYDMPEDEKNMTGVLACSTSMSAQELLYR